MYTHTAALMNAAAGCALPSPAPAGAPVRSISENKYVVIYIYRERERDIHIHITYTYTRSRPGRTTRTMAWEGNVCKVGAGCDVVERSANR